MKPTIPRLKLTVFVNEKEVIKTQEKTDQNGNIKPAGEIYKIKIMDFGIAGDIWTNKKVFELVAEQTHCELEFEVNRTEKGGIALGKLVDCTVVGE